MSTKQIIDAFFKAVKAKDDKTIFDLLDDHVVFDEVAEQQPITGKSLVFDKFKQFFQWITSIEPNVQNALYSENTAMVERVNRLVIGDKTVILPVVTVFKVKEGKIILFRDYFDTALFQKQMA